MTTRWADSFEDADASSVTAEYVVITGVALTTGRRSSTSALDFNAYTSLISRAIEGTEATMFASFASKLGTLPTSNVNVRPLFEFRENATVHVSLHVNASGALLVYRGALTTLLGTAPAVYTAGNWKWVQIKVVIHDTTGSVEIRDASGTVLLALTGIDTRNGGSGFCNTIAMGSANAIGCYHDDLHVWDSTGSICNTFTNDTRVDHEVATGAGNSAQFTASAGANWECVDEQPVNTTDYVESSTVGHKDTYAFGDIAHAPPSIFAVVVTAFGIKSDAGARSLKTVVRSGGTDYADAAGTTLEEGSYKRAVSVRETDPNTAAAWTVSGVNAAEFGFENV